MFLISILVIIAGLSLIATAVEGLALNALAQKVASVSSVCLQAASFVVMYSICIAMGWSVLSLVVYFAAIIWTVSITTATLFEILKNGRTNGALAS